MRKFLLMYDELVKRLRFYQDGTLYYKQAADAIEELSKKLDESIPKSDAEIIIEELSKPRWIPVTERLPDVGECVLCYCHANIFGVLKMRTDGKWVQATNAVDVVYLSGFVTHWMPLKPPVKEGRA